MEKGNMHRYNRGMKLALTVVLSILVLPSCGDGGENSPSRNAAENDTAGVFQLADSAASAISSCSYDFRVLGTGSYADQPGITGTLSGVLNDDMDAPALRVEMAYDSVPEDGVTPETAFIFVWGKDSAWAYDINQGLLTRGSLEEGASDLVRPVSYAVMNEFFIDAPFSDEIESEYESEGTDTVGNVQCNTYLVTYASGQRSRWCIGVEDHLPRRVERIMEDRQGSEFSVVLEISDLDLDPLSEVSFNAPEVPEGTEVENYSAFLQVGTEAPDWTLTDSEGNEISLESLRGRIVVLDFWATWCSPCVTVMPQLQEVHEAYSREAVSVYGVNVWENGDPEAFMDENGFSYGLLLEGDPVAEEYRVSGIPTMYVIDQSGVIALAEVGANPDIGTLLAEEIDSLMEN